MSFKALAEHMRPFGEHHHVARSAAVLALQNSSFAVQSYTPSLAEHIRTFSRAMCLAQALRHYTDPIPWARPTSNVQRYVGHAYAEEL